MQKTWTELLGPLDGDCMVDGTDIVRRMGENVFRILWHFDTHLNAITAYMAWVQEQQTQPTTGD